MPDEIFLDPIEKQKIIDINKQKNRVALNLSGEEVKKHHLIYDEDFMNVNRTINENKLISKALKASVDQDFQLTDKQKNHLRNVRSRNKSHILLNQQKFFGDSSDMTDVKESIRFLEFTLDASTMKTESLDNIEQAFKDAIEACQTYENKKNPWFSKGKARKKMVVKRKKALQKELTFFKVAREHVSKLPEGSNEIPEKAMDLLEIGRALMAEVAAQANKEDVLEEEKNIEGNINKEEQKKDEIKKEEKKEEKKGIKVKWLTLKESTNPDWQEFAQKQAKRLENDKTNAMIKDQKADQEVWDKLCDNWETLNSGKTYEELGESDAFYDFVLPTAELIGKAFGMSANSNVKELKFLARDRYGLGDRAGVLFKDYNNDNGYFYT